MPNVLRRALPLALFLMPSIPARAQTGEGQVAANTALPDELGDPSPAANVADAAPVIALPPVDRTPPKAPPATNDGPEPAVAPPPAADATEPRPRATPPATSPASTRPLPQPVAPAPAPPATPSATAPASPPGPSGREGTWIWVLAAAAVLAVGIVLRRRPARRAAARPDATAPPSPPPEPVQPVGAARPAASSPSSVPAALVTIGFDPARAGLNLLSATAEGMFTLRNVGDRPARGLRFGALLLPAHADQAAELRQLWAGPVTRPLVLPFDLMPGEERHIRHALAFPRDAIVPIDANGRPMFVPVIAVSLLYDRGTGEEGQVGRAWVLGVVRGDRDKLAPLWLDEPPRTRDDVAARPHTASVDR